MCLETYFQLSLHPTPPNKKTSKMSQPDQALQRGFPLDGTKEARKPL